MKTKDTETLNFRVCGLKIKFMIDRHPDWLFRLFVCTGEGRRKKKAVSVPLSQIQKCSSELRQISGLEANCLLNSGDNKLSS